MPGVPIESVTSVIFVSLLDALAQRRLTGACALSSFMANSSDDVSECVMY